MSRLSRPRRSALFVFAIAVFLSFSGGQPRASVLGTGTEVEPNGTPATATPIVLPPGNNPIVRMTGSISPPPPPPALADVDYFRLDVPAALANSNVWICTDTGGATPSNDTVVQLLASDGTTELERDDDDGTGSGCASPESNRRSSVIAGRQLVTAGTYYIRIVEFASDEAISEYRLFVALTSVNYMPETEPNETAPAAITVIPLPGADPSVVVQASIDVANDQDYYAITTFALRTITVMATGDPERDGSSTDLRLTLFGSNGTGVLLTAEGTNAGGP